MLLDPETKGCLTKVKSVGQPIFESMNGSYLEQLFVIQSKLYEFFKSHLVVSW